MFPKKAQEINNIVGNHKSCQKEREICENIQLNSFVASLKMEHEIPQNEINGFKAIFSLFTKKTLRLLPKGVPFARGSLLMPSIVLVVIIVHTVFLFVFVAAVSWKLAALEKAFEKQEPSK